MTAFNRNLSSWGDERDRERCEVLIVEDDAASREEYCEYLTGLGYTCHLAADGATALKCISENPGVGIVLTDLDMPGLDGLSLLSELQARFTPFRPLIPIVVTGMATLETAVEVMRSEAIDFLPKPVSPTLLASAMRRASARWTMLYGQFRLFRLVDLSNVTTIKSRNPFIPPQDGAGPDRETLQKFVRWMIKARQRRAEYMDTSKFADPAWDIMLDLTSAALEGRSVPAFSVSVAANVPMTTALRYVKRLVEDGIVKRWDDPDDKRRSLLALDDQALENMLRYLSSVWRSINDENIASA